MFAIGMLVGPLVQIIVLIVYGLIIVGVVWLVRSIMKMVDSIGRIALSLDEIKRELKEMREKQ